jgi:hypothetical protein
MTIGAVRGLRGLILVLFAAALLTAACGDDDSMPAATATALCRNEPLPPPGPNGPSDPWTQARVSLPASVAVLSPTSMPDSFGEPELLEACTDALIGDDGPRYTVIYHSSTNPAEAIVFVLGPAFAEWGNFPGPPTSIGQTTVRGVTAELAVTERASANDPTLTSLRVVWKETGADYQVRAVTRGTVTKEELLKIAQSLTPVE